MPAVKQKELVDQLSLASEEERHQSLCFLANSVIGNRNKKDQYAKLGVVPSLVYILQEANSSISDRIKASNILGSLTFGGDDSLQALKDNQAARALLDVLAVQEEPALMEALIRALKSLFSVMKLGKYQLLQDKDIERLVHLLNPVAWRVPPHSIIQAARIGQHAAKAIAYCCGSHDLQMKWFTAGAAGELLILANCGFVKAQESALEALTNLCYQNIVISNFVGHNTFTVYVANTFVKDEDKKQKNKVDNQQHHRDVLVQLLYHSDAHLRLLATTCVVNMYRVGSINDRAEQVKLSVMPTLIRMLQCDDPWVEERASITFAYLVGESAELQESASETDVIPALCSILETLTDEDELSSSLNKNTPQKPISVCSLQNGPNRKESILLAIAAVCSLKEDCRKKVVETRILPRIVAALSHASPRVRIAACMCTRSLSRSVKNLRTALVDAEVSAPICKLLSDPVIEVQNMALTTLCNLVLDFSALKKTVLEQGILVQLVELIGSENTQQRMNASAVMTALTFERLVALLDDNDEITQEHTFGLLRNLICGKETDVAIVLEGIGENVLLDQLSSKLRHTNTQVVVQTIYVIANMATGSEQHKTSLMENSSIINGIVECLDHEATAVREGAVWCIINLCWYENTAPNELRGVRERIRKFNSFGVLDRIRQLANDPDPNLRERVATALID
ncbi:armadillo-type protein [Syncephalis fuscata]|nr:armadillo-type protein [Syncephalis fuscata]